MSKNVNSMLFVLLRDVSFGKKDMLVLYQKDTIKSCFIRVSKPDKPYNRCKSFEKRGFESK